jgi:uncharacterized delta-60 repeat protein
VRSDPSRQPSSNASKAPSRLKWLLPFAITLALSVGSAVAAPGDLDPSFGTGGKSTPELPPSRVATRASAVVVQPDGKILAAIDPTLVRYQPDGTPDPSFGGDGVVDSPVGASAIALQSDGKIVVGSSGGVARFDPSGNLDSAFGNNGVAPPVGGSGLGYDQLATGAIAVRSDGKIVAAGHVLSCREPKPKRAPTVGLVCDPHGALGLYRGDGSIETGFGGGDGVATATDTTEFVGVATHDGRISTLAARQPVSGELRSDQVFAYGPAGAPDPSFGGGDGRAPVPASGDGHAISVLASGKLLVAGQTAATTGHSDFMLAQLSSNGSVDQAFGGGDGVVTTDFGAGDAARALAVDDSGRIVVGGDIKSIACFAASTDGCEVDFGIARYLADGSADASFGSGGLVRTRLAGPIGTSLSSLAVGTDGGAVVGGGISPETKPFGAILARYQADGDPEAGFGGGDGILIKEGYSPSGSVVGDAGLQSDGSIIVVGASDADATSERIAVARYTPDGALDSSFADGDGVFTVRFGDFIGNAGSVAIEADDKVVVGTQGEFGVLRLTADGALDPSFGGDGFLRSPLGPALGTEVALQADGKVLAAGARNGPIKPGRSPTFLIRYRRDGTLDPAFGGDGVVTTRFGSDPLAVQRDGRIVGAGVAEKGLVQSLVLSRFRRNGRLDRSFGRGGIVRTGVRTIPNYVTGPRGSVDLGIQPSDRLVVLIPGGLVRFNRDGTRDRSFGGRRNGVARLGLKYEETGYLAMQPDGRFVVAGWYRDPASHEVWFGVTRYRADGRLDPTFGKGGRVVTSPGPDLTGGASTPLVQPDRKIVVVGDAFTKDFSSLRFALARYSG